MSLLERLLGALTPLLTGSARLQPRPPYAPYRDITANEAYNRLFCDIDPSGELPAAVEALQALAADDTAEGGLRYLAYARLRHLQRDVPARVLLGVIVELRHEAGLEILAGYSHGAVRVIQPSERSALVVGIDSVARQVRRLLAAAAPAMTHIGPWARDRTRLPPPLAGAVRLSFLASDGWYFGEGPQQSMAQGEMGGPIIRAAQELQESVAALKLC